MKTTKQVTEKGYKRILRSALSGLFILGLVMFIGGDVNGKGIIKDNSNDKTIIKQINKIIKYPNSIDLGNSDEIFVYFELLPDGIIEVNFVEGENEELKNYVAMMLDGQKVADADGENKKYGLPIKFKGA